MPESSRRSVLVVESNPTALKLLRLMLEAEGYGVRAAGDARTALEQVEFDCPDLVLQDLLLPDMGGTELLHALRGLRAERRLPVVALSGFKTLLDRAQQEPDGFDAILVKPVQPAQLLELVRRYAPLPERMDDTFGTGKSVLVIDDDPLSLKLARLRLERAGFEVRTASEGAAALEAAHSRPPNVVLCDVLMPGTDGYELCQSLRSLPALRDTPVVLVSAYYGGALDEKLARSVGASALVTRTPELDTVIEALREAMSHSPEKPTSGVELPREEHLDRVVAQLERRAQTNAGFAERSALQDAQLAILAGIAEALLRSEDVAGAFGDILGACLDAGGISRGALYRIDEQGDLQLTEALGFPDRATPALERAFGCSARVTGARHGTVVPVSTCLSESDARVLFAKLELTAAVFIPFLEGERCIGALLLGSSSAEVGEPDLMALARAIGAQVSQALALAESFSRLRDAAEAGRVLAASLDFDETLAAFAQLATARLADVCEVAILGQELRVFTSGRVGDPELGRRVRALRADYPRSAESTEHPGSGIRSQLVADISDARLQRAAHGAEHLKLLRELGFKSEIIVPLEARGRTLGSVSFARLRTGRAFTERDRAAAEDLASRAAVALDSATLYKQAQSANRMKDEFLATVSHELRTPLTSILGWARILIAGAPIAKREHAYRVIERNANAQVQLIEDLLDTSRIISGQMRIQLESTDFARVIDLALESLKPALELKRIELRRSLPDEALELRADAARLQQVLWNLLSNAVKFTPSGGHIEIAAAASAGHVVFTVRDDGQGIAPEFLDLVFDPFKQADGGITRTQGGLGLGLAISRHLVELHGGTISVYSAGKDCGATFTVELPLADARPATPEKHFSELVPLRVAMLEDVHVLVVDDDPDTRELLVECLQESGARARGAASAAEAFEALTRHRPDLLLSDIGMPGEDGYTLMRRIRCLSAAQGGATPAAAITAYTRPEDRALALAAGFQLHLVKPIDPESLVAAMVRLKSMTVSAKAG